MVVELGETESWRYDTPSLNYLKYFQIVDKIGLQIHTH